MKNIFKIIASLFIILTISTNISYASDLTESNNYDNFIIEFIEETKGDFDEDGIDNCTWHKGFNIDNIIELYGLDENINGYIYEISSNGNKAGFVQIDVITGQPIVAGFGFNDEHAVNKMLASSKVKQINNKIYYMGNYNYLVEGSNAASNESDTNLYNLRTGEKVQPPSELKKQYVTNANYDILVEIIGLIFILIMAITFLSIKDKGRRSMKKKIGLILALIIAVIFLSVKLYPVVFYVSMEDTLGIKFSEVDKIESSKYGQSIEILEKNEIDEILSKYKNTKVKKNLDQRLREGSSIGITLYKNDQKVGSIDCKDSGAQISRKNGRVKYYTAIDAPSFEEIKEIEKKLLLNYKIGSPQVLK